MKRKLFQGIPDTLERLIVEFAPDHRDIFKAVLDELVTPRYVCSECKRFTPDERLLSFVPVVMCSNCCTECPGCNNIFANSLNYIDECLACNVNVCMDCSDVCGTCDAFRCDRGAHDVTWIHGARVPPFSTCNVCRDAVEQL